MIAGMHTAGILVLSVRVLSQKVGQLLWLLLLQTSRPMNNQP